MKQATRTHLRRLEARRRRPGQLGRRHFVGVQHGATFDGWVENPSVNGSYDAPLHLLSDDGNLPAAARRYTEAELDGFEREGWSVQCIRYGYPEAPPALPERLAQFQAHLDRWLPAPPD